MQICISSGTGDQWLKCDGTQGNAVPPPPIYGLKRSPPQIVIILEKGTRPLSGRRGKPECI